MHIKLMGELPNRLKYSQPHSHDEWEIVYCLEGEGVLKIGDMEIPFREGDIVVEPPGVEHLTVSKDGFRDMYMIINDYEPFSSGVCVFRDDEEHIFRHLFSYMLRIYFRQDKGYRLLLDSLYDSAYQILKGWSDEKGVNPAVTTLRNKIADEFSDPYFDLMEEMSRLGYSVDHLRRLFVEDSGVSPIQYLTRHRLEYAKKLLKEYNRSYSIKDVAQMSGYLDPYYFSRIFKKHVGVSPREYSSRYLEKR